MKQIFNDLWRGSQASMPGHLITFRTYLLTRKNGNVFFYNSWVNNDFEKIKNLGGVDIQYLSHNHEVHTNLKSIKKEFGSRLAAHPYIRQELFGLTKLDEALGFNEKIIHSGNILIIPTPGHTNSSLCYYYLSPTGKTYLFVGDTLYFMNNKWQTYIMPSHGGCVEDMKASLLKLRTLEVDVIVCSIISQHDVFEVTQDEWHTIIDGILEAL